MLNQDDPSGHPTDKYRKLSVVPAIELASGMPHKKGKQAARTTNVIEVRNNQVHTRTVSGKTKN
jgi:hypothetical protein